MPVKLTPAMPKKDQKTKRKVKLTPANTASPEDDGHVDTALDAAYGAAQGATFNFADELYGA